MMQLTMSKCSVVSTVTLNFDTLNMAAFSLTSSLKVDFIPIFPSKKASLNNYILDKPWFSRQHLFYLFLTSSAVVKLIPVSVRNRLEKCRRVVTCLGLFASSVIFGKANTDESMQRNICKVGSKQSK